MQKQPAPNHRTCFRCAAHGVTVKFSFVHLQYCPYYKCKCHVCSRGKSKSSNGNKTHFPGRRGELNNAPKSRQKEEWTLFCAYCKAHGRDVYDRGQHDRYCKFRSCSCELCTKVREGKKQNVERGKDFCKFCWFHGQSVYAIGQHLNYCRFRTCACKFCKEEREAATGSESTPTHGVTRGAAVKKTSNTSSIVTNDSSNPKGQDRPPTTPTDTERKRKQRSRSPSPLAKRSKPPSPDRSKLLPNCTFCANHGFKFPLKEHHNSVCLFRSCQCDPCRTQRRLVKLGKGQASSSTVSLNETRRVDQVKKPCAIVAPVVSSVRRNAIGQKPGTSTTSITSSETVRSDSSNKDQNKHPHRNTTYDQKSARSEEIVDNQNDEDHYEGSSSSEHDCPPNKPAEKVKETEPNRDAKGAVSCILAASDTQDKEEHAVTHDTSNKDHDKKKCSNATDLKSGGLQEDAATPDDEDPQESGTTSEHNIEPNQPTAEKEVKEAEPSRDAEDAVCIPAAPDTQDKEEHAVMHDTSNKDHGEEKCSNTTDLKSGGLQEDAAPPDDEDPRKAGTSPEHNIELNQPAAETEVKEAEPSRDAEDAVSCIPAAPVTQDKEEHTVSHDTPNNDSGEEKCSDATDLKTGGLQEDAATPDDEDPREAGTLSEHNIEPNQPAAETEVKEAEPSRDAEDAVSCIPAAPVTQDKEEHTVSHDTSNNDIGEEKCSDATDLKSGGLQEDAATPDDEDPREAGTLPEHNIEPNQPAAETEVKEAEPSRDAEDAVSCIPAAPVTQDKEEHAVMHDTSNNDHGEEKCSNTADLRSGGLQEHAATPDDEDPRKAGTLSEHNIEPNQPTAETEVKEAEPSRDAEDAVCIPAAPDTQDKEERTVSHDTSNNDHGEVKYRNASDVKSRSLKIPDAPKDLDKAIVTVPLENLVESLHISKTIAESKDCKELKGPETSMNIEKASNINFLSKKLDPSNDKTLSSDNHKSVLIQGSGSARSQCDVLINDFTIEGCGNLASKAPQEGHLPASSPLPPTSKEVSSLTTSRPLCATGSSIVSNNINLNIITPHSTESGCKESDKNISTVAISPIESCSNDNVQTNSLASPDNTNNEDQYSVQESNMRNSVDTVLCESADQAKKTLLTHEVVEDEDEVVESAQNMPNTAPEDDNSASNGKVVSDLCLSLVEDLAKLGRNLQKAIPPRRNSFSADAQNNNRNVCDKSKQLNSCAHIATSAVEHSSKSNTVCENVLSSPIGTTDPCVSASACDHESDVVKRKVAGASKKGGATHYNSSGSELLDAESTKAKGLIGNHNKSKSCKDSKSDKKSATNSESNHIGEVTAKESVVDSVQLQCQVCKKTFTTTAQLRLHGYFQHSIDFESSPETNYPCRECSLECSNELVKNDHECSAHMDLVPLEQLLRLFAVISNNENRKKSTPDPPK